MDANVGAAFARVGASVPVRACICACVRVCVHVCASKYQTNMNMSAYRTNKDMSAAHNPDVSWKCSLLRAIKLSHPRTWISTLSIRSSDLMPSPVEKNLTIHDLSTTATHVSEQNSAKHLLISYSCITPFLGVVWRRPFFFMQPTCKNSMGCQWPLGGPFSRVQNLLNHY